MHPLLSRWLTIRDHLSEDLLGGPRPLKLAWVINAQKGGTIFFVLALMVAYDVWTPTAWAYLGLHGSYGLLWLLKDAVFPDPNWEKRVTLPAGLAVWATVLGPYWLAPVLIVTRNIQAPAWLIGACIVVYAIGVVLMMAADAQKYFVLRARKGLITDGFFARVRHPNYLGEMMLYGSFAALTMQPWPWLVLAWVWLGVFLPNILRKEASMARYPAWADYKARSGIILPKLW